MESDPDIKKMMERLLHISESNNRILRRMRREMLWSRFAKLIYLVIIIGAIVAGYYYFKPYLGSLQNAAAILNQFKNFKIPGQ